MSVIFELDKVCFDYPGGIPALADVSFSIARGESVAIVGANGSGKSTLLHMLDGLYFASSGTVSAFGQALSEELTESPDFGPVFRKEVGFVFQNSDAQLFCPTVYEELAFGPLQIESLSKDEITGRIEDALKLLHIGHLRDRVPNTLSTGEKKRVAHEITGRIEDALKLLHIGHLRDRVPNTLSTGEKKRVALASVLVVSPSVLLLDEPTAGLDPRSQSNLLNILQSLHEAGLTVITATHDMALLPHLAERVIVFGEDHRLVADRSVGDLLADLDLLLSMNLIHEHTHRHGHTIHSHPHTHVPAHEHEHGGEG